MKRKRKAKRKARPADSEPAGDEEEEDDDDVAGGGEDDEDEEVQMEFEFYNPDEDDYHSVAEHLKSGTWDFVELNFSELADDVVNQGNVGTLVKSDADSSTKEETVCGLLTALNLQQFKHRSWPSVVAKALNAKAGKHADAATAEKMQALLQKASKGAQVGLLLSERFENLPPELVGPLHSALQADIAWSCSTPECPEDERPFYRFTHFVGVARLTCPGGGDEAAASPGAGASRPKKKRRSGAPSAAGAESARSDGMERPSRYLRFEDEAYVKGSDFSFTFPLSTARQGSPPEHRVVFGISRKAFEQVVRGLESESASAGAPASAKK